MKRRSFLQSLAGFVGFAITSDVSAKEKQLPTPIDLGPITPKPYIETNPFGFLTIDNFGAKDTICINPNLCPDGFVTKKYVDYVASGMTWNAPDVWFPKEAELGYCFSFFPETYQGIPLDQITKDRLHGCYIYTESGWSHFIGIAKTDSNSS